MSLNLNAVRGYILEACSEHDFFGQGHQRYRESFLIDGIIDYVHPSHLILILPKGLNITANRLFGPQPRTRTYVCVWEIGVGPVKALLTTHDSRILVASLDAFRLNYTDLANSPAAEFGVPVDPDGEGKRLWTSASTDKSLSNFYQVFNWPC